MRTTILFGLIVMAIGSISLARARMRSDRQSHERDGLARFRASFSGQNFPEELLNGTYTYLVERREAAGESADEHYEVAPGHDLRTVYHLDALDIEDAVLVIADRASARLPKAHELDELKGQVSTVSDLVLFLEPYFEGEPAQG